MYILNFAHLLCNKLAFIKGSKQRESDLQSTSNKAQVFEGRQFYREAHRIKIIEEISCQKNLPGYTFTSYTLTSITSVDHEASLQHNVCNKAKSKKCNSKK